MRARQPESGNPVFDTFDDRLAVALDLGEESIPVGDDEPEVANAGLVNTWIVDLIDDAVTDGEPDSATLAERGPDPVLGARGSPSRNSRPPGRFDHVLPLKGARPWRAAVEPSTGQMFEFRGGGVCEGAIQVTFERGGTRLRIDGWESDA